MFTLLKNLINFFLIKIRLFRVWKKTFHNVHSILIILYFCCLLLAYIIITNPQIACLMEIKLPMIDKIINYLSIEEEIKSYIKKLCLIINIEETTFNFYLFIIIISLIIIIFFFISSPLLIIIFIYLIKLMSKIILNIISNNIILLDSYLINIQRYLNYQEKADIWSALVNELKHKQQGTGWDLSPFAESMLNNTNISSDFFESHQKNWLKSEDIFTDFEFFNQLLDPNVSALVTASSSASDFALLCITLMLFSIQSITYIFCGYHLYCHLAYLLKETQERDVLPNQDVEIYDIFSYCYYLYSSFSVKALVDNNSYIWLLFL